MSGAPDRVELGRVDGAFGVQGWIRLTSYTRPPEGIFAYRGWRIGDEPREVLEGRRQGNSLVARLAGLSGREAAAALRGAAIEVDRAELPKAPAGTYYWADLLGCVVANEQGVKLGKLQSLFSTGAQDVMVVRGDRERLIPFVSGPIVKAVDLGKREITVDWGEEF